MIEIKIHRLDDNYDIPLPRYMSSGASGMDLYAAVTEPVTIQPKNFDIIPLGIKIAVPDGYEAQIRPRSGLAARNGIGLLNSPGTIDSDYRGEIKVIMFNFGDKPFTINRGDRIAQMIIAQVIKVRLMKTDDLDDTQRGSGGFGHTGV
ncbi:dUTP diphosphatase [Candidatus Poribacteria bacterium]|nr:dUTP diphosphatase [Candidatus Poribacteria bacterium]